MEHENNKQVVKYSVNEAAIAKMSKIYMNLTITDLDNKEQFDQVHDARIIMRDHRTRVNETRIAANADALEWQRKNNKNAKVLINLMAPVEDYLKGVEAPVIEKEKRIKAEKEEAQRELTQNRVEQLQAVGLVVSFDEAGSYTVNHFLGLLETETLRFEAEKKRLAQEEADRKAEDARLERVKAEQDAEAERLNRKTEKMRVEQKEYDDKQEVIRVEREAEISRQIKAGADRLRIAQKKIDDEKAELEAEKDRIKVAKEAEEAEEVAKFLADEKAEADAKRKEQEAIDKKAADEKEKKRQEALKPDVEKLGKFGHELLEIRGPELKDPDMKAYLESALDKIYNLADNMIDDFD